MLVKWSKHLLKNKAREWALDISRKKEVILLPGAELCCLKYGIEHGIFGPNTVCHLVEREWETFKIIEEVSRSLPVVSKCFHGELHDLKVLMDLVEK